MSGKKLFESTVWYAGGNIILRAANFLLLPIYSHFITPEEFGVISLLLAFYAIASAVYQFGLPAALTKFYLDKNQSNQKIIFSTAFWFLLFFGLSLGLVLFLLGDILTLLLIGDSGSRQLFNIILVILIVESIASYAMQLLKTKEEAKRTVVINAIGAVANIILTLILLVQYEFGISAILISQLVGAVIIAVVTLSISKRELIFTFDKKLFYEMTKFSLPLMIGGILTACVDFMDRFFLDLYLAKEEVGLYSFAYRIAIVMNLFVIGFRTAWTPRSIAEYNSGNYEHTFGKYFSALISSLLVFFLLIALFAKYLFEIKIGNEFLFNQEYILGITILPFVLLGYLFNGLISFYSFYPFVSGKGYHFLISDAIAFATNIVFNLLLIPKYGLTGAAIATSFSFMFSYVYLASISSNKIKIKYSYPEIFLLILFATFIYAAAMYIDLFHIKLLLFVLFTSFVAKKYLSKNFLLYFSRKD